MTITLARGTEAGSRGVIGQIARFEGRRLITSTFLLLATLGSGALAWVVLRSVPATLDWRSVALAGACLPIASVALLLAHRAAGRDRWSRVGELATAPPSDLDRRMLGLAAAVWAPMVLSLLVVVFGVAPALSDDPAGSWNLAELAVGPLVVVLGHIAGVALGRWAPHPLVAPLALVLLAGLFMVDNLRFGARTIPAASPFLPWRAPYTEWVQGEPRLPLIHLLYLAGLVILFAALSSRRWRALIGSTVVVLAGVVVLSGLEVGGEDVVASVQEWGETQTRVCSDHDGITFCAIEGYQTWIDDWATTVEGVDELVPTTLGVREVEQTTGAAFFDTDPSVAQVGGHWEGPTSFAASSLAIQVLAPELGLPGTAGEAAEMNTGVPECMAMTMPLLVSGQARAVGLIVLDELVVPNTFQPDPFAGRDASPVQFEQLELSRGETDLASQILDRPREEIVSTLQGNWEALVDPETSTTALAGWFGLDPPEIITESAYADMTCSCTADGGVQCTGGRP